MQVSKEELLHIARLADLKIKDEEVESYMKNLEEILNYATVVNNAPIDGLDESIGVNDAYNVFRKDEIKQCTAKEELLQNAPSQQMGMFKIPKVLH